MKWKPVLCVAVLALAAGCSTHQQNPYASFGEYGFSYDLQQSPVPGLTVAENERISHMPAASPTLFFTASGAAVIAPASAPTVEIVSPTAAPSANP